MIITSKYSISSTKVDKDIVICQLSDLHYNDQTNSIKPDKIINALAPSRVDMVLVKKR